METKIETKIELAATSRKGERFYFVIEKHADGWFEFKFTNKHGKTVDPRPLLDIDVLEIRGALKRLVKGSDEEED